MTEKRRTPYQEEMDRVHVPEEKARETLRMMLEENRRLRAAESAERKPAGIRRMLPWFAVPVAAALLLVIGLTAGGRGLRFADIRMRDLPVMGAVRGGEAAEAGFAETFGTGAEELFAGWTVAAEKTETQRMPAGELHTARLTLEKDGREIRAEVTDYEPALFTALPENGQAIEGVGVRLARDTETGELAAVYPKGSLYIVLRGNMAEKDFTSAIRELVRP